MDRRRFLGAGIGMLATGPAALSGCSALPRSGPLTADMASAERPEDVEGLVADLTPGVAEAVTAPPPAGFPSAFLDAAPIDPTRIGVDDRLDITVWETPGAGVLSAAGGPTTIEGVTVDPAGRVFIPFAGPQRAAGATLADLRMRIQESLSSLILDPQVDVRLREPQSRSVAVQGAVARPGVYPIERPTARLGAMIAAAGGATTPPERIDVAIQRGGAVGRQILADVLENPRLDVALRPGDQIVLTPIRERFIALGASGAQAEFGFPTRPLSLLSALGAARGLRDFDADPTGVFVLRFEDPAVADALLPGPPPDAAPLGPGRPIVYRLDMSQPEGFFVAREFGMRDGDAIFVTNAPLTELRKFLQLFNAVVTPVNTVDTFPLQ